MEETEQHVKQQESLHISIISSNKFLLLNLLTLNLYTIWWMYKAWTCIRHKENSDILPVPRALFGILFIYSLFQKIRTFALEHAFPRDFSPLMLFLAIIIVNVVPAFPAIKENFGILSLLASIFFIAPNEALNYALLNAKDFDAVEEEGITVNQFILIFIGICLWSVYLDSMFNG